MFMKIETGRQDRSDTTGQEGRNRKEMTDEKVRKYRAAKKTLDSGQVF